MAQDKRLIVDIEKQFGAFHLQIQLTVGTGICVLFGASGAGKTQTLNAIAGLMTPDSGEITLDGVPFFRHRDEGTKINLPARERHVGYVFQQYALFPHLTAIENVAYALWRRSDARKRAVELLERMHLGRLADRYPSELSGGQQQRVAIARALAADSKVLLLDEPFSALDRANRERLHQDVLSLQAESQLVVLYVTHNLEDAFAMGHQLAIVYDGKIEQFGTPETIFRQPANFNVARTLGMTNLFQARVMAMTESSVQLDWHGLLLEAASSSQVEIGATVTAYIRPEEIQIISENPSVEIEPQNYLNGTLIRKQVGYQFHTLRVRLRNEQEIEIAIPASQPLNSLPDGEIHLALPKSKLRVLPYT